MLGPKTQGLRILEEKLIRVVKPLEPRFLRWKKVIPWLLSLEFDVIVMITEMLTLILKMDYLRTGR
jgi:hypothetical protein